MLGEARLRELLSPFTIVEGERAELPEIWLASFQVYLELLAKWNARTNLTAVRDPEIMVQRHLGESLFAALWLRHHAPAKARLLDFGSGAGLPGLPIQIVLRDWSVLLAESQGKKVAFLREAVRTLGLSTEVWPGRVEALPEQRLFEVVTMRAVDKMEAMRPAALSRLVTGGMLLEMVGRDNGLERGQEVVVPARRDSVLRITRA